ncbi:hypothetical protein RNAN_3751 [Rheinheimera nanhaiensis E407-8]|uniref:Flavodoxin-like fold domain-containing protein n=1 Tax=Rheinheimera nanhaiensis E407-8 TaxID=562729 RepID=I1E347_9GAMM|nr:NAD(P)H-dependent oxidoreductase [Rheinheimera nanhaiensis]GAB60725.1 hypothetical protein RNAN_3751 [Rheinheimera nanhaiensis E407-8]
MSSKKVLIISVHSDAERLGQALAAAYADAATAAGHSVRWLQLDKLNFNPVFSGYSKSPALEPDLQAAQADLLWVQHISLVYPIWWAAHRRY